jgi:hypothetical protein
MFERWLPVAGFEGLYEVSSLGQVKSLRSGNLMVPVRVSDGYLGVKLYKAGVENARGIHRMVCEAFHGSPTPGLHAAHLDGNPTNNRADNLAWKTPKENAAHKIVHGTHQAGEMHPRVKLTAAQVAEIRSSPLTSPQLAPIFGVHQATIRHIRQGVRWAVGSQSGPEGIAQPISEPTHES